VDDGAEFSGKTIKDAIAAAEHHYGTGQDTLNITVVRPGRGGVFGIGAEQAVVRALPQGAGADVAIAEKETFASGDVHDLNRVDQTSQRVDDHVMESRHEQTDAATYATDEEDEYGSEQDEFQEDDHATGAPALSTATREELAEEARVVLTDLLKTMGFDLEVSVRSTDTPIMLVVQGDNLGVLIGRRGDNLGSLQFMVNLILSKNRRSWPRVVVDIENYRERREEALRGLAERIGFRVARNGRPFTLEAMPAGDRRIIHVALRENADIETYSIGEGPSRRVVVAPKR